MVDYGIKNSDIDLRKYLMKNIFFVGGNSKIENFNNSILQKLKN